MMQGDVCVVATFPNIKYTFSFGVLLHKISTDIKIRNRKTLGCNKQNK